MTLSADTTSTRRAAGDALDVIPTGAALGAEVRGVDLRNLDAAAFTRLMQAWHDHSVVLVRGQRLSDQDLIAFSRRFGDLDWAPIQETGRRFVEGQPEIYIVSNVKVNGEPIGSLGDGEAVWHTDMSYLDVPPKASMLYALEVPPTGGNTSFCSMYGIYEALPGGLKARIAGLKIKHDGTYNSGGYVRQGVAATDDPMASPGAVHPLVCTHPKAGGGALSRPAAQRVHRGAGACRIRGVARRALELRERRSSAGTTSGASAISSCGTTAARCIGAMRSNRKPAHHASHADQGRAAAGRLSGSRKQRVQYQGGMKIAVRRTASTAAAPARPQPRRPTAPCPCRRRPRSVPAPSGR